MTEIQNSISEIATAMKAKLVRTSTIEEKIDRAYDDQPLRREDLETLFALKAEQPDADTETAELRESERTERETMAMIRNALYAE